jgi:hypothetical protein
MRTTYWILDEDLLGVSIGASEVVRTQLSSLLQYGDGNKSYRFPATREVVLINRS